MATVAPTIENWDDDLELEGALPTQSASTLPSISSRLSIRSASNAGDEEWQLPLQINDDFSTLKAISSAKEAGIPIPSNVPASALSGGSIKRLGKKKTLTNAVEEWGDDLEDPDRIIGSLQLRPFSVDQRLMMDEKDEPEEWAEDSLGIRSAGARHHSKNRSSSASALSPSMGSILTQESEEDGLDGLIIPQGPINLEAALKRRRDAGEADQSIKRAYTASNGAIARMSFEQASPQKEDFFADIDFGAADGLDPKRRALNRNVKLTWTPVRNRNSSLRTQTSITFTDRASVTKIPRPILPPHARRLDPVLEVGATAISQGRKFEPTTTSAQLLRSKRSMPVLRNQSSSSTKPSQGALLHGGTSDAQSHHTSVKPQLQSNLRQDFEYSRAKSPSPRTQSRLSTIAAPETPPRIRRDIAPASLAQEAAARKTVTKPARRRNFGDGTELDTFDDLPTSVVKESKFIKQPSARPSSKVLRAQLSQGKLGLRDKMTTPQPKLPPYSPTKFESIPRFARDTAASRIAREQTIGAVKPRGEGALMPRTNWAAHVAARSPHSSPSAHRPKKKGPQLVNPMGKENVKHFQDEAAKKGMHWNSTLCRWEGNESDLLSFDPTASAASPSPSRPALITNFSGTTGVQVVGGMVFDPQRMCWLKLGATPSDPLSPTGEESDDPFKDIKDLEDNRPSIDVGSAVTRNASNTGEWLVGEEFDLGPEFIRRQREEELIWKSRVSQWFGEGREWEGEDYKWTIRDIAATVAI